MIPLPSKDPKPNSYWVFIHDTDVAVDSNDKEGTVKILTIEDDKLESGQVITSGDFAVSPTVPINSVEVFGEKHLFMAIGGKGVGYINLTPTQGE